MQQPGITVDQAEKRSNGTSQNSNVTTSNDFLSDNPVSSKSTVQERTIDAISNILDGSVSNIRNTSNGKVTATVNLGNSNSRSSRSTSDRNSEFLQKGAGPLQEIPANVSQVTFTLNKEGTKVEKAVFTSDGVTYELTFDALQKVVRSAAVNAADPSSLSNNFTIEYQGDMSRITYANYQNGGALISEVTQTTSVQGGQKIRQTSIVEYYDLTPDTRFRMVTISENLDRGNYSLRSELMFGEEDPILELEINGTTRAPVLTFPTAYGDYTVSLPSFKSYYELFENKAWSVFSTINLRQNFLQMFEMQTGYEANLNDLINNLSVVETAEDCYAVFDFKSYPLILTFNTDPDTIETKFLNFTPDKNKNGKLDRSDTRAVESLATTARYFLQSGEALDYANFVNTAIPLSDDAVYYEGQVIRFTKIGNRVLILRYSDGSSTVVFKRGRQQPRIFRSFWRR